MYETVNETAERWNVTRQMVWALIKANRIPGAVKKGRDWLIPEGTEKPANNKPGPNNETLPKLLARRY
jgi:excisionase family DNA binding protein